MSSHIDEVNDDEATDVAKYELPGDFSCCLQVGLEGGFLLTGRSGVAARVDIVGRCWTSLSGVGTSGQSAAADGSARMHGGPVFSYSGRRKSDGGELLKLEIRCPGVADLEALARSLPMHTPDRHREGVEEQASGLIHYLIAWQGGEGVGHGMIHWSGPRDAEILARVGPSPEIFNLGVRRDRRSSGVGTVLMAALERSIAERGFRESGLGVALDNPRARALYDRLGYTPADAPVYVDRWHYVDEHGVQHRQDDRCTYMIKVLDGGWDSDLGSAF